MEIYKKGKFYEICKINKNGSTGKRIGVVRAKSYKTAIRKLKPRYSKIRIFPVKLRKR